MNEKRLPFTKQTPPLLLLGLCLHLATPAQADESSGPTSSPVLLNGEVKTSVVREDEATQSENPESDNKFQVALTKLKSGAKMTSADYRDLQIGITGCNTLRLTGRHIAQVEDIVPGSPAEKAGLQIGDIEPLRDEQVFTDTTPTWQWNFARAGTTVDLPILRNGEITHFNLVRMNIEDIPDAKLRQQYENMARRLGTSEEGSVLVKKGHAPLIMKLAKFAL